MQIAKLDHVNLRTTQLDAMVDWYAEVLGLRSGERPPFPFPGAWMYAGEAAVVHLVGVDAPATGSETELKLEHFAFSATGRADLEARLKARGARYELSPVPAIGIVQVNVWDPDGNHIHIDFPAEE